MRAIKNFRIRSQAAESRRRGRWQEKNLEYLQARQDREEIRKERQDSAPPLHRDNFRTTESSQQNTERSESRYAAEITLHLEGHEHLHRPEYQIQLVDKVPQEVPLLHGERNVVDRGQKLHKGGEPEAAPATATPVEHTGPIQVVNISHIASHRGTAISTASSKLRSCLVESRLSAAIRPVSSLLANPIRTDITVRYIISSHTTDIVHATLP